MFIIKPFTNHMLVEGFTFSILNSWSVTPQIILIVSCVPQATERGKEKLYWTFCERKN